MTKHKSQLILILRDSIGCYYFKPDSGMPELWRWSLECNNVSSEECVQKCVKIAGRRGIRISESNIVSLGEFQTSKTSRSFLGKSYTVVTTIQPFLVDFTGFLPKVVVGLIKYNEDFEFYSSVMLPERPAHAA